MTSSDITKNIFQRSNSKPEVFVSAGKGAYDNTRKALSRIDLSAAAGKQVLLKPNVGRVAGPGSGITTDPQVVAAAIDAFVDAGAEVAVGESPIVGVMAFDAFEASGITAVVRDRECKLIDMNKRKYVEINVSDGMAVNALRVCPEVLEYDVIVSIPVMKTHMHTGVTLSVKNMKGCLWRRSKVKFHMLPEIGSCDEKSLDVAIADMSGVLRPHLSIIDGTVGMEGLGPSAGDPKPLDAVVVSLDSYAADSVACGLMGLEAENVAHLRICAERGHGVIDLKKISVIPEDWRKWINPFTPPPENLSIEFPDVRIFDKNSCSACQSTLFLFLKYYSKKLFDYMPSPVCIAIGKGAGNVPDGTLCIGNCTADQRKCQIFVEGCPPVSSEILHVISGKPSVDTRDGYGEKKGKK